LVKPVKPQELLILLEEKLKNREESAEVSHWPFRFGQIFNLSSLNRLDEVWIFL
jgi:hypothetical protein